MINTKMTEAQLANEAIEMFLEWRDIHGKNEEEARSLAVGEVVQGIAAEQELRTTGELPDDLPFSLTTIINRKVVLSDGELSDRSHIQRHQYPNTALCGEHLTPTPAPSGMRICLRCLIQALRDTIQYYEDLLNRGMAY